jgi:integrase
MDFFPEKKKLKYIPSPEDVDKVIASAGIDVQDYLWAIKDTAARMGEINRLTWEDVNLEQRYVVLYTRKKKGGHLTPRKVPMAQRLHRILSRRYQERDRPKPWVFWHSYRSRCTGEKLDLPYKDRNKSMKTLCQKAGVRYFRFHALRHAGASLMDCCGARMGDIQRILGQENRRTTEIYLHAIGDGQREAIAILERPIGKKSHTSPTQEN